jgi:Zn-dependent peptidase ImmA (M78 family)
MSQKENRVVVKPMSRSKISEITSALRSVLGIAETAYFPIVYFIENLLLRIDPKFEFIICSKEEMGCQEGLTIPDKHIMKIREDVYIGATKYHNPRDLFTLAHELAHYVLHTSDGVVFSRINGKVEAFRDPEWQANTFAAELMCPSKVAKYMSEEDIVAAFRVSKKVAKIQSTIR